MEKNVWCDCTEYRRGISQLVKQGEDHKTVNYNGLIGVLIEAVKELSDEVKELKGRLDEK